MNTVKTQLSVDYVPDWTIEKAIGESWQNMLDESLASNCHHKIDLDDSTMTLTLRDYGRGVDFNDILLLGKSGKRGMAGMVGVHGEGEIVGSLVLARLGIVKTMYSQCWRAIATIKDNRLVILSDNIEPMTGTMWTFQAPDRESWQLIKSAVSKLRDSYRHHQAIVGERRTLLPNEPGRLFSNGLYVSGHASLALGYNLKSNPGRDRSGFNLDSTVERECESIFRAHGSEELATVVERIQLAEYASFREVNWNIDQSQLDSLVRYDMGKAIAKDVTGSRSKYAIVWASRDTSDAVIADCTEKGYLVISAQRYGHSSYRLGNWIQELFPRAETASTVRPPEPRQCAKPLRTASELIADLAGMDVEILSFVIVPDMEGAAACADRNIGQVTYNLSSIRECRPQAWVDTLIHELAHIFSNGEDCTRRHADGISTLSGRIMSNIASDSKRATEYRRALRYFARWQKSLEW